MLPDPPAHVAGSVVTYVQSCAGCNITTCPSFQGCHGIMSRASPLQQRPVIVKAAQFLQIACWGGRQVPGCSRRSCQSTSGR